MIQNARFEMLDKIAVDVANVGQTLVAMTAGTVYTGFLTPAPILDSNGDGVAGFGNKSFSATGSVFVTEMRTAVECTVNGYYFINYKTGYYYVKAGASATPVTSWKIKVQSDGGGNSENGQNQTWDVKTALAVSDTTIVHAIGASTVKIGFMSDVDCYYRFTTSAIDVISTNDLSFFGSQQMFMPIPRKLGSTVYLQLKVLNSGDTGTCRIVEM